MGFETSKTLYSKVKQREGFTPHPDHAHILYLLKAIDYDRPDDINLLVLAIKDSLDELKDKWKTLDKKKLTLMIKRCLINELWKLEERKHVRREQKEILRKIQEAKERKEEVEQKSES